MRATLLTGLTVHQHGAYTHEDQRADVKRPDAFSAVPTLPGLLRKDGYLLADDAIGFLRGPAVGKERKEPFFLWLAFTAPHVPLGPNPPAAEKLYADVISRCGGRSWRSDATATQDV